MPKILHYLLLPIAAGLLQFAHPTARAASLSFKETPLKIPVDRSGLHWAKLNNDALADLFVAEDQKFLIYYQTPRGTFSEIDVQTIEVPGGGIYDLADLDGDSIMEIVLMTQSEVDVYKFDPRSKQMVKSPTPLLTGLRGTAVQHLVPANFMTDIDGDGDLDLIYPVDGKYYLYFNDHGTFTKKNQISTKPVVVRMSMGEDELPGSLSASVTIPGLEFIDLNGDGRKDLRVTNKERESFYLQSADGIIPETPSYEVDLKRFKSELPEKTGNLQAAQFQFLPSDLNGDGRQDYVIVAGNKIWVFLATENGVDFDKPNQILKVSAESMNAVLLPLNKDDFPDLVIMKYQIPSLGRIVAGLAIGLRFEVEFLGYDNGGPTLFSRQPNHRSTMVFKVPPILKLLGELDTITQQFRDVQSQVKKAGSGDFNGDGKQDILKIQGNGIDFYFGEPGQNKAEVEPIENFANDEFINKTLFGEKQREVTLDTLLSLFSDFVNSFTAAAIAGRQPGFNLKLDAGTEERVERIFCHDLNGDGLDDIVLFLSDKKEDEKKKPGPEDDFQTLDIWLSQPSQAPGVASPGSGSR